MGGIFVIHLRHFPYILDYVIAVEIGVEVLDEDLPVD